MGVAVRYQDWDQRLFKAEKELANAEMQYGDFDCCLATVKLLESMTGVNYAAGIKGYKNRKGARSIIAQYGSLDQLVESIAAEHKLQEVPVNFAHRGDPVIVEHNLGRSLGLIDLTGRSIIVAQGRGFTRVPRHMAERAWRLE